LPCVASRVELLPFLQFEWNAFAALSTDRPVGLDRGAIPWRSIHHFGERYGLVGDEFERLASLIRAMDAVYLEHCRAADEAKRRQRGNAS
jgi:hypothetical protein